MSRPRVATYLHAQTVQTSRPIEQVRWVGASVPHFSAVRAGLVEALEEFPTMPLREADPALFLAVHTPGYLSTLEAMARGEPVVERPRLSGECHGFEHCLQGYRYGLGGMCEAIDQMRRGDLRRAYCFSLGGHHSFADRGHGYCLLNPMAAAVRYAQSCGFARVLIVDWDIHHGDGTQAIFANDPTVYCLSIHSGVDLYMMKASDFRAGFATAARAIGHCNIPLIDPIFDDETLVELGFEGPVWRAAESLAAFEDALARLPWRPDLVCVFSGYDSHRDDCGANLTDWTDDDFDALTRRVTAVAREADCPVLSVHGGGYKLPVTLSAARRHVRALADG